MRSLVLVLCSCAVLAGCALVPERLHEPQLHNPFPQLSRVAVLPFFNQSNEPTLDGFAVANAYRNQLQKIPGFEVMPVGVVERLLEANHVQLDGATDFQQLARALNVDVVIVGAVTDFYEYYPPRMGLAVNWYAANPYFQPIPPGYGLPWGSAEEEFVPEALRFEAEFAAAQQQLSALTPAPPSAASSGVAAGDTAADSNDSAGSAGEGSDASSASGAGWADASAQPVLHHGPIIQLVRQYNGNDAAFTRRLANYYRFRDDARFGGWQSYLQRKDDFISFCCYLHIAEILAARGGAGQTRVVWRRWIDRYER